MTSAIVKEIRDTFHSNHMLWNAESYESLFQLVQSKGQTGKESLDLLAKAIPPLAAGNESLLRKYYSWHVTKSIELGLMASDTNTVQAVSALLALKRNSQNNNTSDPGSVRRRNSRRSSKRKQRSSKRKQRSSKRKD